MFLPFIILFTQARIFTLSLSANDWKGLTFTIVLFYKGIRCPPDVINVIRFLLITLVAFWLFFRWSRMEAVIDIVRLSSLPNQPGYRKIIWMELGWTQMELWLFPLMYVSICIQSAPASILQAV